MGKKFLMKICRGCVKILDGAFLRSNNRLTIDTYKKWPRLDPAVVLLGYWTQKETSVPSM